MEFLTIQSEKYDLAIWSASKADYVRWIIRSTSLRYFKYKFIHTRKHCKVKADSPGSLKDFKVLTAEMLEYDRICFLDDTPACVVPIEIAEKVPEYRGVVGDCFLREWVQGGNYLCFLVHVGNHATNLLDILFL